MRPIEVVVASEKKVRCNGSNANSGGSSSHPLIYLDMGKKNEVICPYCSCCFTLKNADKNS
ncbi:MAG: putative Zn-finger protein [Rickettsiales bacterium]|jgi:uncharacterized Zn-finger protein